MRIDLFYKYVLSYYREIVFVKKQTIDGGSEYGKAKEKMDEAAFDRRYHRCRFGVDRRGFAAVYGPVPRRT